MIGEQEHHRCRSVSCSLYAFALLITNWQIEQDEFTRVQFNNHSAAGSRPAYYG